MGKKQDGKEQQAKARMGGDRAGALAAGAQPRGPLAAAHGQAAACIIEGRDTAGKGGVIGACRYAQPAPVPNRGAAQPTERERTQWYFQRYVPHLPAAGEIVLFDRSWYNRAGVEFGDGLLQRAETAAFLKQAPVFEKLLVDDGILLFKYWLTVDQAQQEERFAERLADPLKRWKLSPVDLKAREKYADYTQARHAMLKATHSDHAPWTWSTSTTSAAAG
jgi:polyphosphate kinase 2 (PPK2 family)